MGEVLGSGADYGPGERQTESGLGSESGLVAVRRPEFLGGNIG